MTMASALVLNGSPSTGGNSMFLAQTIIQELGARALTHHLYREHVEPCRACLACQDGGACPLTDAMPAILDDFSASDYIILASPLHFTSLSAPLVAFISRLQPFWQARKRGAPVGSRRRAGALAVTGGSNYPDMFRPARSVALAAFKTLEIPFAGMLAIADTDRVSARDNPAARTGAAELAEMLRAMQENGT